MSHKKQRHGWLGWLTGGLAFGRRWRQDASAIRPAAFETWIDLIIVLYYSITTGRVCMFLSYIHVRSAISG